MNEVNVGRRLGFSAYMVARVSHDLGVMLSECFLGKSEISIGALS
jgi:hypothetical protein